MKYIAGIANTSSLQDIWDFQSYMKLIYRSGVPCCATMVIRPPGIGHTPLSDILAVAVSGRCGAPVCRLGCCFSECVRSRGRLNITYNILKVHSAWLSDAQTSHLASSKKTSFHTLPVPTIFRAEEIPRHPKLAWRIPCGIVDLFGVYFGIVDPFSII